MDWLIPDTPDRLAELVSEQAGGNGPFLATGAPAPGSEVRRTAPADDAVVVSTARLADEPDVRARDLTVSVSAGVRIDDLQVELADRGLWLALGGPARGRSAAGAVAAGGAGPWDLSFGDVARQLLACELVTWGATRARWGRAVMKDVAGYGTTRAAVGSAGRLGVLHRLVFRVWPRPETAVAVGLAADDPLAAAGRLATSDFDAEVRPDALVWRPTDPDAVGRPLEAWLVGPGVSVAARRERLEAFVATAGVEAAGAREATGPEELESGEGEKSAGAEDEERRPLETSVLVLRPGRSDFADVARSAGNALGDAASEITGYPMEGVLRIAYRRGDRAAAGGAGGGSEPAPAGADASTPRPLAALLEAVGDVPARAERASAAEHAALSGRREAAARALEERVLEAMEGRPRHWLSDYL